MVVGLEGFLHQSLFRFRRFIRQLLVTIVYSHVENLDFPSKLFSFRYTLMNVSCRVSDAASLSRQILYENRYTVSSYRRTSSVNARASPVAGQPDKLVVRQQPGRSLCHWLDALSEEEESGNVILTYQNRKPLASLMFWPAICIFDREAFCEIDRSDRRGVMKDIMGAALLGELLAALARSSALRKSLGGVPPEDADAVVRRMVSEVERVASEGLPTAAPAARQKPPLYPTQPPRRTGRGSAAQTVPGSRCSRGTCSAASSGEQSIRAGTISSQCHSGSRSSASEASKRSAAARYHTTTCSGSGIVAAAFAASRGGADTAFSRSIEVYHSGRTGTIPHATSGSATRSGCSRRSIPEG